MSVCARCIRAYVSTRKIFSSYDDDDDQDDEGDDFSWGGKVLMVEVY